ncbi:MAG TPA: hypothetical protein ENK10_09200 [Acidobacteria bacterium]|nr:hypothetical protein [Acidobacteriota bacterium]
MTWSTKPTRLAAADLGAYLRVDIDSNGKYALADASTAGVGVTEYAVSAGDHAGIAPLNGGGTREMTAAGAIGEGADVYAAAGGKVQALPAVAGTYYKVGVAFEAASADGDVIEVMPIEIGKETTVV